jgi:hypothetical protein
MSYTASQLVTLACQICNVPGRTSQVGQFLNMILADHAQTMDEDTIRKTTTLNISPQAIIPYFYALPSDYLRFYDVFYLVSGEPFYLNQIELKDLDRQFTGSGINNYPESFATDMSQNPQATAGTSPSISFYPPTSVPLAVTVRYRPQTADIVTPETSSTIPWFPNQRILLKELCLEAGSLADDSRVQNWEAEVERRMKKYMIMSDDTEGFSATVKLDARTFRPRSDFPPSKKTGF